MISIPGTVEDHGLDALALGLLGEQLARGLAARDLAAGVDLRTLALVGDAHQHHAAIVVDQLGVDVLERTEYHEPGTARGPGDLFPHSEVAPDPALTARARRVDVTHYFAPVLPALRRTCSPW